MDNCFGCGKSGHKVRDCSNVRGQYKGSGQAPLSGSNEAPQKHHIYAHRSRAMREAKVLEFIKLHHGGVSVH